MTHVDDGPVTFDPLEEGFVASPYEQYARLRDADPVHRSSLLHGWVVTRFEDVGAILRDPSVSSDIDNATPTPLTQPEISRRDEQARGGNTLVLADDPEHARLRKLLAKPFRPREIELLREQVVERVARTLDAIRDERGSEATFDLIEEFAYPLPVEIFCDMLGVPDEDHPQFRHWTQCVARSLDPVMDDDEREECMHGVDAMYGYLEVHAIEKREHPDDDLMSSLVHAEVDGERLTHEDLMAQLLTLYVAGHEPTASLIGNGTLALLRDRPQLERLRAEPELRRNAISELLRFDGPNQFVRRVATSTMQLGGETIEAGDVIYASPGSANRDPRRWGDSADSVIVDRPDAGQHLQFGAGVHACLGSHLARLQAEVAFTAIFDRLDDLQLAGEPEWSTRMVIRGLNRLPVCASILR
jgi:cytochrome P450